MEGKWWWLFCFRFSSTDATAGWFYIKGLATLLHTPHHHHDAAKLRTIAQGCMRPHLSTCPCSRRRHPLLPPPKIKRHLFLDSQSSTHVSSMKFQTKKAESTSGIVSCDLPRKPCTIFLLLRFSRHPHVHCSSCASSVVTCHGPFWLESGCSVDDRVAITI